MRYYFQVFWVENRKVSNITGSLGRQPCCLLKWTSTFKQKYPVYWWHELCKIWSPIFVDFSKYSLRPLWFFKTLYENPFISMLIQVFLKPLAPTTKSSIELIPDYQSRGLFFLTSLYVQWWTLSKMIFFCYSKSKTSVFQEFQSQGSWSQPYWFCH